MTNQNKNISFDLNQFQKIEDIIFLDEPILTHLIKNNKHFLQYLVDTSENKDTYLLLELEEQAIFDYLTKLVTLRQIISTNQNFIYRIEQDFNGNILNAEITQSSALPENYLPTEDSYLNYEPSSQSYYYNFIKEFESQSYLRSLREQAFYIKLAPTNSKYSDTIGFNELVSELLKNISTSFKSFLKADFFESFKERQTDEKKLNASFNRLSNDLDYRMVDLDFGSFEIGLAVDKVMKQSIENKEIRDWAIDVGYKYRNIVLDDDYDEETVSTIISNYSQEDRKKIFEPIFKITENSNFDFKVKNSKSKEYSKINIKDKSKIDRIVPPKIDVPEEVKSKEYEIIQVTTIKEKDKVRKSIRLDENTLFESSNAKQVILKKKDFEKFDYSLDFDVEIPLDISTEKGQIVLRTEFDGIEFEKTLDSGKFDDGIKQIVSSIYEYIVNKSE
ncbi:hypothetical protein JJL45_11510 [Tamlana sp. s12]|uniref:hypothetical protein n=1 Tax=Tamlana sp. s12 TaxID=1630406 RepID=UPI0008025518|nr:hypothetical protein [Tamlana sp. s12]OBQ51766.1 hypothetical protein VQ01_14915 [Tamlana sp. s12]QQY81550.1 hypothetical protein JJL45_11510 [Tamlana sp. s12]